MQNGRQMRFTDSELALVKGTFAENEELLKLMRKVFLPELDPSAPIQQMIDLYMTLPTENQTPDEIAINLKARNILIAHLEMQLGQLRTLAGMKNESVEQTQERLQKNSNK